MSTLYPSTDRSHLSPDDAFSTHRGIPHEAGRCGDVDNGVANSTSRHTKGLNQSKRRNRKRKATWKKLLWVKQSYPDNYTDEETFLDALQRNPRLRPYEFWQLMADSTVIVQQVCTMVLFVCCFSFIFQSRVSPVTVVSWGSVGTLMGWVIWDGWVGQEQTSQAAAAKVTATNSDTVTEPPFSRDNAGPITAGLGSNENYADNQGLYDEPPSRFSRRNQERFATAKSALLICFALLGLSPILKSLTRSTASDSIWAISFWLMCLHLIFFDYSSGIGASFPASLSTNAALMASTVLASRLPSTIHVFSLTLFSIEVFGLFPVFRRYLRHMSWTGHLALTWMLVVGASGGVALCISNGGIATAIVGVILGCVLTGLAMGLCSWWLIGLQRFKNEIHGPWDPARPIIKRWE